MDLSTLFHELLSPYGYRVQGSHSLSYQVVDSYGSSHQCPTIHVLQDGSIQEQYVRDIIYRWRNPNENMEWTKQPYILHRDYDFGESLIADTITKTLYVPASDCLYGISGDELITYRYVVHKRSTGRIGVWCHCISRDGAFRDYCMKHFMQDKTQEELHAYIETGELPDGFGGHLAPSTPHYKGDLVMRSLSNSLYVRLDNKWEKVDESTFARLLPYMNNPELQNEYTMFKNIEETHPI